MVMTVHSLNSFLISSYIFYSVMISIFAVASSIITTLFFLRIDLQMQMSCFSPELKLPPFSVISKSSPFKARLSIDSELYFDKTSVKPALSSSSRISLSL